MMAGAGPDGAVLLSERGNLRGDKALGAALGAVTASVVGVILNLAI